MAKLAAKEVASVAPAADHRNGHAADAESRVRAAEAAVAGMVLYERVLVALVVERRAATQGWMGPAQGTHDPVQACWKTTSRMTATRPLVACVD